MHVHADLVRELFHLFFVVDDIPGVQELVQHGWQIVHRLRDKKSLVKIVLVADRHPEVDGPLLQGLFPECQFQVTMQLHLGHAHEGVVRHAGKFSRNARASNP